MTQKRGTPTGRPHTDRALLERLFERALARTSACASLHIEVLPAAGAA